MNKNINKKNEKILEDFKEVKIKLIKDRNKILFTSQNCEDGWEQMDLLMNGLSKCLFEIKLKNDLSDVKMNSYLKFILNNILNNINFLANEKLKNL